MFNVTIKEVKTTVESAKLSSVITNPNANLSITSEALDKESQKVHYEITVSKKFLSPQASSDEVGSTTVSIREPLTGKVVKVKDSFLLARKLTQVETEIVKTGTASSLEDRASIIKDLISEIRREIGEKRQSLRAEILSEEVRDGYKARKLGSVYVDGNSFVKTLARKIRNTIMSGQGYKPSEGDNDNYVGIEIELASKLTREQLADLIVDDGLSKFVVLKSDSSIRAGRDALKEHAHGHELNILVKESELVEVVTKLCGMLNTKGHVKVDKSCGLHVHVDMRNRDHKAAFSNLMATQSFFYAMLPASRKTSTYSKPLKGNRAWREVDRYSGINTSAYGKYKTIEMRMHSGTTEADKIINWAQLILAVVKAPAIPRAPSSIKGFRRSVDISDSLCQYMVARINKFHKQHDDLVKNGLDTFDLVEIADPEIESIDTSIFEESEAA